MKKILEVCLSPDLGGLELHMKDLTKFLKVKGVINKKSKLKAIFQKENLPYFEIGRYSFLKLAKIIDDEKIDVVHLQWTKDIPTTVLAKLISKQNPKIVQTRNMHMTRFKDDFYHKFLYKNIDTMIAVTAMVKNQLEKFIPQTVRPKIKMCYIGANTPKVLTQEEKTVLKTSWGLDNEFVVAIVGRIEEAKGQHIVLQAVAKLREVGINAKTLIIGHAMNESYLENLKATYKEDIFTGFVNNASNLMQIADCLVLATKKETFGLVLIEAMKCGICILGSNQGGPLEIIDGEKDGLLFESMNSDDLYEKLLLLSKESELKNTLAKNGKIKADTCFDSTTQFGIIRDILEEV